MKQISDIVKTNSMEYLLSFATLKYVQLYMHIQN